MLSFQLGRLKKNFGPSGFSDKSSSVRPERAIRLIWSDAWSVIPLFFKHRTFRGFEKLADIPRWIN